jgi:hypothetical protein
VIAPIPTDVLAPLIETLAPHAAPDESWPATDRDIRAAASEAITTTIGPAGGVCYRIGSRAQAPR